MFPLPLQPFINGALGIDIQLKKKNLESDSQSIISCNDVTGIKNSIMNTRYLLQHPYLGVI